MLEREKIQQPRPTANISSLISHHFWLLHLCSNKIEFHPDHQSWHVHSFCFWFTFFPISGSLHTYSLLLLMPLWILLYLENISKSFKTWFKCSFSQKWSLLSKSVPGGISLCSKWLPILGSLGALTTLYIVIACLFYCFPHWIWGPWKQEPCHTYLCTLSN